MLDPDFSLPAEFEDVLQEIATAPESVRLMWQYALVMVMIDEEKARVIETREEGETLHVVVQTIAGAHFEVVRPPMSEETEQLLLEQIRAIVADDRDEQTV